LLSVFNEDVLKAIKSLRVITREERALEFLQSLHAVVPRLEHILNDDSTVTPLTLTEAEEVLAAAKEVAADEVATIIRNYLAIIRRINK
jgi:hypothetical protein